MSENETPVQTNRLNFGAEAETPVEQPAETAVGVDASDGSETYAQEEVQTAEAEAQPDAVVEEVDGVRTEDAPVHPGEPESNEAYQAAAVDAPAEPVTEETVEAADLTVGDVADANEAVLEATAEEVADTGTPVAVADEGQGNEAVSEEGTEAPRVEIAAEAAVEGEDSVESLKAKQDEIQAKIAAKQQAEKNSVLEQIKTVAANYNITANEIADFMGGYRSKRLGVPAKPKYRDPATGKTWSGRGKAPLWLKDQDRSKFLIA